AQAELRGLEGEPGGIVKWLGLVQGKLNGNELRDPADYALLLTMRSVCQRAAVRLHHKQKPILDALLTEAQAGDRDVRTAAIAALGEFGPAGQAAVSVLTVALRDADQVVSEEARRALWQIQAPAKIARLARPPEA